ncbi:hypothetical protein PI124_g1134 [Phytophthora idaei]|nr:hypothetical protein PI125_g391 [Phytophthora idaei]KAG3167895.1 hypothetical protein PI126_g3605 [Phytophthora idaei]KAG3254303.1 hypothetical protein PI124_g1134 [Phytophthora idaei]
MRFSFMFVLLAAFILANVAHADFVDRVFQGRQELKEDDDFEPSREWIKKWIAEMDRWVDERKDPMVVTRYFNKQNNREAREKLNLSTAAWWGKNPNITTGVGVS